VTPITPELFQEARVGSRVGFGSPARKIFQIVNYLTLPERSAVHIKVDIAPVCLQITAVSDVRNFKGLPASTQQDILNFLRAL
jgi:hypothetical protein